MVLEYTTIPKWLERCLLVIGFVVTNWKSILIALFLVAVAWWAFAYGHIEISFSQKGTG